MSPGAAELVRRLDIDAPLRDADRLSMGEYEALRRADTESPPRAPSGERRAAGPARFLGVDAGERRLYG